MQRRFYLTLLALVGLVLNTQAADEAPARHVEKSGGFSIIPPNGWKVREFPGQKFKIIQGPAHDGFAPNIVFTDDAFQGDLPGYVAANKKTVNGFFKDVKDVGENEVKTNDGVRGVRW